MRVRWSQPLSLHSLGFSIPLYLVDLKITLSSPFSVKLHCGDPGWEDSLLLSAVLLPTVSLLLLYQMWYVTWQHEPCKSCFVHSTGLLSRETFCEYQNAMTAIFCTAFHVCIFVHNFKDRTCSKMCASSKNSPSPMRGGSGPVFSKLMTTPLWTFWTRDSRHWFNILCVRTQYDRPERKTGGTTIRCNQENCEYYETVNSTDTRWIRKNKWWCENRAPK